jgi:hypothetical protein
MDSLSLRLPVRRGPLCRRRLEMLPERRPRIGAQQCTLLHRAWRVRVGGRGVTRRRKRPPSDPPRRQPCGTSSVLRGAGRASHASASRCRWHPLPRAPPLQPYGGCAFSKRHSVHVATSALAGRSPASASSRSSGRPAHQAILVAAERLHAAWRLLVRLPEDRTPQEQAASEEGRRNLPACLPACPPILYSLTRGTSVRALVRVCVCACADGVSALCGSLASPLAALRCSC